MTATLYLTNTSNTVFHFRGIVQFPDLMWANFICNEFVCTPWGIRWVFQGEVFLLLDMVVVGSDAGGMGVITRAYYIDTTGNSL